MTQANNARNQDVCRDIFKGCESEIIEKMEDLNKNALKPRTIQSKIDYLNFNHS